MIQKHNSYNLLFILTICFILNTLKSMAASDDTVSIDDKRQVESPGLPSIKIGKTNYKKISSIEELVFNNIEVPNYGKPSKQLKFDLPTDAVSFTIVIYKNENLFSYVHELIDPSNIEIIKSNITAAKEAEYRNLLTPNFYMWNRPQMTPESPNIIYPGVFSEFSVTPVPNSDTVKIKSGIWKFSISHQFSNDNNIPQDGSTLLTKANYKLSVFIKKSSESFTNKTIGYVPLKLYTTNNSGIILSEDNFKNINSELKSALQSYFKNGIKLDIIKQKNAVLDTNVTYDESDFSSNQNVKNLIRLWSLPKSDNERAINIYILKDIQNNEAGFSFYAGSVSSFFNESSEKFGGVLIRNNVGSTSFNLGRVLIHEVSHYLGLYHTSEDNITDSFSYQSHVYNLNNKNSTNKDPKNLMEEGENGGDFLSLGQKYVLLRNIFVSNYTPID